MIADKLVFSMVSLDVSSSLIKCFIDEIALFNPLPPLHKNYLINQINAK
jgi:hypothetical protein